ncbi:hypothetical protein GDO86_009752 [Hymenochirus boettgeri]|uniref:Uncharacterized protein n=1 Tax=Hymenochirus boettgeri TaxID=247094 RepID=A0A8T2JHQ2_9PIPI|nr:hypothetical protein GDO86_009752 [Hymenochirus boettgeri]
MFAPSTASALNSFLVQLFEDIEKSVLWPVVVHVLHTAMIFLPIRSNSKSPKLCTHSRFGTRRMVIADIKLTCCLLLGLC